MLPRVPTTTTTQPTSVKIYFLITYISESRRSSLRHVLVPFLSFPFLLPGHSSSTRVDAARLVQTIDQSLNAAQQRVQGDMSTRISEIRKMENTLESTRDQVNTEMGRLTASIEELDAHLAYLRVGPLPTATENLKMRERRIGIDLVVSSSEKEKNPVLYCTEIH